MTVNTFDLGVVKDPELNESSMLDWLREKSSILDCRLIGPRGANEPDAWPSSLWLALATRRSMIAPYSFRQDPR